MKHDHFQLSLFLDSNKKNLDISIEKKCQQNDFLPPLSISISGKYLAIHFFFTEENEAIDYAHRARKEFDEGLFNNVLDSLIMGIECYKTYSNNQIGG